MAAMLAIDGSWREGGGQVLRTALALWVLTSTPLRVTNIRARRAEPGLMPQHLKAVEASAAICDGRVEGARLGARELSFFPKSVRQGHYRFHIGTAGATSMVLQTIFLPLALASGGSEVTITRGTHVPWSPCYHYLEKRWLLSVACIGYRAALRLEQAGFYPRGGGAILAEILRRPS